MSPGGGRRASARAAPYPAASRTRTSTLDATRIAAGRRAPQTRRSEQVRKGTRRGGLVQEGERDGVLSIFRATETRGIGQTHYSPAPAHWTQQCARTSTSHADDRLLQRRLKPCTLIFYLYFVLFFLSLK